MAANVSVYAGTVKAWWQNLLTGGKKLEVGLSASEAGRQSGIFDTEYSKRPVYVKLEDGTMQEIPDREAIVRGPVPETDALVKGHWDTSDLKGNETLEVVSKRYELVTPVKMLEILDSVSDAKFVEDDENPWTVNTIGLLRGGRKLFVSLDMGEETLFGDEREHVKWNLFVGSDFTRRGGIYVMATPIQVVCENTWTFAMDRGQQKKSRMTIPHTADAAALMELSVAMHRKAAQQQEDMRTLMERMAQVAINEEQAVDVIKAMYPVKDKQADAEALVVRGVSAKTRERAMARLDKASHNWDLASSRALERRKFAMDIYERYQDTRGGAGTVYGLFGALIDAAQHRKGRGDSVYASLYGERQKEINRAYNALRPLVYGQERTPKLKVAVGMSGKDAQKLIDSVE